MTAVDQFLAEQCRFEVDVNIDLKNLRSRGYFKGIAD
jgi:hypothetical protein